MQNTIKQRFDLQYMTHTMNTTYRSKKRVTRMMARCTQGVAKVYPRCTQGVPKVYPRCPQALGRLMSKLRSSLGAAWEQPGSSLGAAWEQPRRSLGAAYSMLMTTFLRPFSCKRAELERRLAANEITARLQRAYGSSLTSLRLTISMLLMLTLGSGSAWGQSPVDITTDTNGNGTIEDSEKKFYLIQTNAFPSFYIAPQNNNITTTISSTIVRGNTSTTTMATQEVSILRISLPCLTPTRKSASLNSL